LVSTILYAGVLQGCVVSLLVFRSRSSNRVLALLLSILTIDLFAEALYFSGDIRHLAHLMGIEVPLNFLYGPLLWWYCSILTQDVKVRFRQQWWQLIPAAITAVIWSGFYISPIQEKLSILTKLEALGATDETTLFFWLLHIIHGLFYSGWVLLKVRRYQVRLKESYSMVDGLQLRWLFILSSVCAFLWVGGLAQWLLLINNIEISTTLLMLPTLAIALALYGMGYMALITPDIFMVRPSSRPANLGNKIPHEESTNRVDQNKKGFQLSVERIQLIERKLVTAMESDLLYKQADLKLRDLSEYLKTPEHHLSKVLNEAIKQSFYDYVNYYRLTAVKALLANPNMKNRSVLDLGLEAGFNSKSTFYSLFKQAESSTPAQYRNQLLKKTQQE